MCESLDGEASLPTKSHKHTHTHLNKHTQLALPPTTSKYTHGHTAAPLSAPASTNFLAMNANMRDKV